MQELYVLMHKDVVVAEVWVNEGYLQRCDVVQRNERHMPCKPEHLREWLLERTIPETRDRISETGYNKILFQSMLDNYGVSLTDCYWLRPEYDSMRWLDLSPYANDFKVNMNLDDLGDGADEKHYSPNFTLKGDLKKKWVINNGKRVLLKGNYEGEPNQSVNEVFITGLNKSQPQHPEFVEYGFAQMQSSGKLILGCVSDNYTTESLEFVSAWDLIQSRKQKNSDNAYTHYCSFFEDTGIDIRAFLDYQIMLDYVTTNVDRHYNNFGILRNPDTMEMVSVAPIYDCGNSMGYYLRAIPRSLSDMLRTESMPFYKQEVRQLSLVQNRNALDLDALPSPEEMLEFYSEYIKDEENLKRIQQLYRMKIEMLRKFQDGKDVWKLRVGSEPTSFFK